MKTFLSFLPCSLVVLAACGGSFDVGGYAPDAGSRTDAGTDAPADAGTDVTFSSGSLVIHLRATTAPVTHTDGLSGQTPKDQRVGIRALRLYREENDPNPVVAFDNQSNGVEASL